jgi:hypothetical protein
MMQDVCNEVGIPAPSAVVTSTDQQVRQLLALANREGREQASAPGGWPQLRGEQTITMVNGQAAYDFPTDFDSYMPDTIWNRDQRWIVQGPLSAQEWQTLKSGFINVFPYQRYRIMDGQIYFDPTPSSATAGQTVTIEYQSKAWCQSALGVAQTQWRQMALPRCEADGLFRGKGSVGKGCGSRAGALLWRAHVADEYQQCGAGQFPWRRVQPNYGW